MQHTAGTLSNVHHAFEAEDYDAAVQALHGKNIPIERTGVCKDGQRYLFICDPNGNRGNCAHQQGFSTVERQTLAPSLALAEREGSR